MTSTAKRTLMTKEELYQLVDDLPPEQHKAAAAALKQLIPPDTALDDLDYVEFVLARARMTDEDSP